MQSLSPMLIAPAVLPPLDPQFRPAVLANAAFRKQAQQSGAPLSVQIGLEQSDGSLFHIETPVLPESHPCATLNVPYLERLLKFLLWSRGGCRVYFSGPESLAAALRRYYQEDPCGKFDAHIMGDRIYERPFEVVHTDQPPPDRAMTSPLGRHLNGCRIGFDLGASDRKVAAVLNGTCVFSEETVWNPVPQTDPQWHFDQIMDSLRRAAEHLPRVDAIGGSSAGVIVNSRIQVASLFRGVPPELFQKRVKGLFLELKHAWNGIPFEVANDGEVTALAGSMSISENSVLGIALGSSQAAGYVTSNGTITTWLNELAFAPVDYSPSAPADEWSGDVGCGVQYFSQQAVGRLLAPAGIEVDPHLALPEKLKVVQELSAQGDPRAEKIYQTIGTYLGYGLAHYADFYAFNHVLILGRVTSGAGGATILDRARHVLVTEFPHLDSKISFHIPDEKDKRHGQAIAAASLPKIE